MTKFYKRIGEIRNNEGGLWVKHEDDKFYWSMATHNYVGIENVEDYCDDWELISNDLALKLIEEENKKYPFPEWFNLLTALTVLLDYQEVYENDDFLPDKNKLLEIKENLTDTYKKHREWLVTYHFISKSSLTVTNNFGVFFIDELQWMINNLNN